MYIDFRRNMNTEGLALIVGGVTVEYPSNRMNVEYDSKIPLDHT